MSDVTSAPQAQTPAPEKVHRRVRRWVKNDKVKYRRWTRAFLAWLGGVGAVIIVPGFDAAMSWSLEEWLKRFGVAALFGTVGAINLGDKNPDNKQ